jgi:hypothetical protein
MSVHREHVGELVERFQENVLPKNMHGDGQYESLAPSDLPAWSKLCIHITSNVESRPVSAQGGTATNRESGRANAKMMLKLSLSSRGA